MNEHEFNQYLRSIDYGGPLHIAVGDGNLEDHHLLYCLISLLKRDFPDIYQSREVQFIEKVSELPQEERDELYKGHYDYYARQRK